MHALYHDADSLYRALIRRDPAYDGLAFVAVTTTGVFCRLTCSARKPRRENCRFFADAGAAVRAGFRPCQRCRPTGPIGATNPLITKLMAAIEARPEKRWRETDLVSHGFDPSTVRRIFKQHFGMTFVHFARARRIGLAAMHLTIGGKVIEAQLEAGYESGSGFRDAFTRMLGEAPARTRGAGFLVADWIDTPLGTMIAIADEHALHLLEFTDRRALPGAIKRLRARTGLFIRHGRTGPVDKVEAAMSEYFSGHLMSFSVPLATQGSDFESSVWHELNRIPIGETRSYRDIAIELGRPSAARAVARANGANPLAIVIPCHRVIASDGSLSGYGGGIWRKRWLLEHEHRVGADRGSYSTVPTPKTAVLGNAQPV